MSGSILQYNNWESDLVAGCARPWLTNPNLKGNFLDLGANIGAYTLPLGRFLQGKGEVISVEGMPDIADRRTSVGRLTDVRRTSVGRTSDVRRTSIGRPSDIRRTSDGRPTDI